jgi:hypothetical protein
MVVVYFPVSDCKYSQETQSLSLQEELKGLERFGFSVNVLLFFLSVCIY